MLTACGLAALRRADRVQLAQVVPQVLATEGDSTVLNLDALAAAASQYRG